MQRRSLLALGTVSAAVLAVGGGVIAVLQPGLREARLSPGAREVFAGVSRGLLDGSLLAGGAALDRELEGLLEPTSNKRCSRACASSSSRTMGGCGAAWDEKRGVTRPDGLHWQIDNLSVHDGSIFPTSIGANPELSIYGIMNRLAQSLAQRLGGREVILA